MSERNAGFGSSRSPIDATLRHTPRSRGWTLPIVVCVWFSIVSGGLALLGRYEHLDGANAPSPEVWPNGTQLYRSTERATLLFFAHPKCPCTRASVGELAELMADCKGKVQAYAIFVKPPQYREERGWEKTSLWSAADRIPGVTALLDKDGIEAHRFQAATSGLAVLYDRDGNLLFRGGITASRGHSGDNLGRSTIVSLLTRGFAQVHQTKVYGCELGNCFIASDQTCCQQ